MMQPKMELKTRFKMYKKGKSWVIAGIVSGACVMGLGWSAQAATSDTADTAISEVAAAPVTSTSDTLTAESTTAGSATADEVNTTDDETTTTDAAATTKPAVDAVTVPTDTTDESNTTPAATVETPTADVTDTPITDDTTAETAPTATDTPTEQPTSDLAPSTTDEAPTDATPALSTTDEPSTDAVPATPTITADPISDVAPTTTDQVTPGAMTKPAVAPTPVTTAATVTVPETRPDLANLPSALETGWTQPAVALVQAELTKPATMTVSHTKETPAIDLWMPNKQLQQIVLAALQELNADDKTWTTVADITQEDLARLKKLIAVGHNGMGTYIDGHTEFSLVGLEHAVNLETIMLTNTLDVGTGAFYGDIVDVTPLANLQHLTTLDLQHNRVHDVTPLTNLQHLENLFLAYNCIQDFSPLNNTVSHAPNNFSYTGQFILLDSVLINEADREGHLQVACTTIDGEVVQLSVTVGVAQPLFYVNGQHTYHVYFTGGNPKPDGHGGVYYTNIQNQQPGATSWPGNDSILVDPLPDYYYLTGVHNPTGGSLDFAVIQPYAISHSAADVTVHYVDEAGVEIAPSTTLKPGLVGEAYATTPETIPHYVLQTTPDNATGVYGDNAIDVTYVYAEEESDAEGPDKPTPPGTDEGGNPTTPGEPGPTTPAPAPDEETPDGDGGNQSGDQGGGQTGGQDGDQGGSQDGGQPDTPGGQGTGDHNTGNHNTGSQPGAGTPGGAHQPGTVTDDGAGDTALPGLTPPSATGSQSAGQVTVLAHSHVTPANAATQPVSTTGATTLPQTGDQPTSAIWGVALLTGMLGWLGLRLKRQHG
ncbi:MucBP domain-containing protein [Levilactobacillus yiduensis]|uniref:MucBP domain-containing protein n=1 Tax=Levilactobacillus yiduensis TaxID=2953880 RepID=UPI001AD83F80|nr:MucBP domain-containing protein [Levilactobacillus yiduensis]